MQENNPMESHEDFHESNFEQHNLNDAEQTKSDFHIDDETDMNEECEDSSQKWDGTKPSDHKRFSESIYQRLPQLLQVACNFLSSDKEREIFFTSALGVISGILPNVKGNYMGAEVEANVYSYIVAPFGEGKSNIEYARRLARPIDRQLKAKGEAEKKAYKSALIKFNKALKANEKSGSDAILEEPTPPVHRKLFLPGNIGKTGFVQLLHENGGRAILFETEGDTLADTLRQDYGNFSDVLRNAYHHQPVSYFRRSTDEDVEVEFPRLAVVLSSTFNQLVRLIPNAENGLFSRFLYYEIEATSVFDNVFSSRKAQYNAFFDELGLQYLQLYNELANRNEAIRFELSDQQQSRFLELFQSIKDELKENVGDSMGGSTNRLGIMCFRIAMLLSVLRSFEKGGLTNTIICQDEDFNNAIDIIGVFKVNMLDMYWKLHKPKQLVAIEGGLDTAKAEQKRLCRELYNERIKAGEKPNYRDIALQVLGSPTKHQTVYRWIHEAA